MTQPQRSQPREEIAPEKKSRKSRRKQRSTSPPTDHVSLESELVKITQTLPVSLVLSMPSQIRLLVCSIGNPGSYINTLHSAGHTVISSLATALSYPSFVKSRAHGNGIVSAGPDFTLWQSSSLMNISGQGVAAAWRQFLKDTRGQEARLVVVHDELECKLGEVKVKKGDASPKGHNGLKSIKEQLRGQEWWRIGVGIGRPESREPNAVADFVLRKMTGMERGRIESAVGRVEMELRKLAS
jgi:PTH1 family peptidyl-tRNA hydrolase